MKWTNSCDALVDFVEEHGGSMGGETRDHLFNIVQNIVGESVPVLETPPPDDFAELFAEQEREAQEELFEARRHVNDFHQPTRDADEYSASGCTCGATDWPCAEKLLWLSILPQPRVVEICYECGSEIRDEYGFAKATSIGIDSQDITESPICAACWFRPSGAPVEPVPAPLVAFEMMIREAHQRLTGAVPFTFSTRHGYGYPTDSIDKVTSLLGNVLRLLKSAPVPAPRLECPTNHCVLPNAPWKVAWKNFEFCPDCGTSLSPPVGPQP